MGADAGPDLEKHLAAVIALLAADRDDRVSDGGTPRRSELVLADAGFTPREIADLTGRKYEAVKSSIRRSKKG